MRDIWGAPIQSTFVPPDQWTVPVETLVKLRTAAWLMQSLYCGMDEITEDEAPGIAEEGYTPYLVEDWHRNNVSKHFDQLTYADLSVGPSLDDLERIRAGLPPLEPNPIVGGPPNRVAGDMARQQPLGLPNPAPLVADVT